MRATIKCYNGNANLFINNNAYSIQWDGMSWDDESEWNEWADEVLVPASEAENYDDVRSLLHIYTQHLIND